MTVKCRRTVLPMESKNENWQYGNIILPICTKVCHGIGKYRDLRLTSYAFG